MAVEERHQGKGIGKKILELLEKNAKKNNAKKNNAKKNSALRAYKKC